MEVRRPCIGLVCCTRNGNYFSYEYCIKFRVEYLPESTTHLQCLYCYVLALKKLPETTGQSSHCLPLFGLLTGAVCIESFFS
jgi:hypothetical protein